MKKTPINRRDVPKAALLTALALSCQVASAGVFYFESSSGDLSSNFAAPTPGGSLTLGANTISGSSVSADRDYISFNVPVGSTLTAIRLTEFVSTDDLIFVALTLGTTSIDPATAGANIGSLLGYTHAGSASTPALLGTDVLDDLAAGPGASGFSTPLGAGDYTLWVQQTNPQNVQYSFDLVAVPEPSATAGVAGVLLVGTAVYRRSRRNSPPKVG